MQSETQVHFSLRFSAIVEKRPNEAYLAHCLELDLVAEGSTLEEACDSLINVIDVQIRTCIANDNLENLYFPAPPEAWSELLRKKQCVTKRHWWFTENDKTVSVDQYCYA